MYLYKNIYVYICVNTHLYIYMKPYTHIHTLIQESNGFCFRMGPSVFYQFLWSEIHLIENCSTVIRLSRCRCRDEVGTGCGVTTFSVRSPSVEGRRHLFLL